VISTLSGVSEEQLSRAVSALLRQLLESEGMSGNQLAKAAGIPQTSIAGKLRGASAFSVDDLAAIAPVLKVKVSELIEWAQRA
jgi:transcriptional regulator with XRE-family HTH domain